MSTSYVALLRGINVGKAKRVAMAELRALVEGLGYGDVRMLLNSGNVVFSAPGDGAPGVMAERIERAMTETLGVSARVTVLSGREFVAVVDANPVAEGPAAPSRFLVAVLRDPADAKKLAPLEREDWGRERLAVVGRAAYLWCPEGLNSSPLADALARTLKEGVTTRNWATVEKLRALLGDG